MGPNPADRLRHLYCGSYRLYYDGCAIARDETPMARVPRTGVGAAFEVLVVGSGEEALIVAAVHRPALSVMDIRLSGNMDGIEAALQLFRTHGLRSVFATAPSDPAMRGRTAPAEPLGWLAKPYGPGPCLRPSGRRSSSQVRQTIGADQFSGDVAADAKRRNHLRPSRAQHALSDRFDLRRRRPWCERRRLERFESKAM